MDIVIRFIRDEEGASMTEYALLLGIVAAGVASIIISMRGSISNIFTNVNTELNTQ
ncbi:MAG: Flp family type IVb pilin [Candidatus Melainabacteria bacterium]|nr:Flp family type IVb pilin [Candidatus Melainabacteria bacterium]